MCSETTVHEYGLEEDIPQDVQLDARRLVHRQMRLTYQAGTDWCVEILEHHHEHISAQAAWAMEDFKRRFGSSVGG